MMNDDYPDFLQTLVQIYCSKSVMHGRRLDWLRRPGGLAANLSMLDFQAVGASKPIAWKACRIFIDANDISSRNQPSLRGFNAGRLGSDVGLKRSKT